MAATRVAVIMAGGSGERFWPLSKPGRPKQLLNLTDPKMTMLEEAVNRIAPLVELRRVFVSTSRDLADPIIASELVQASNVVAEPVKRNTLGALVWMAAVLSHRGLGEATVAVLTSDHKIGDVDLFRREVATALDAAENDGGLVTIGIPPTRPETGFGYLEVEPSSADHGRKAVPVSSFHEKPSFESAQAFAGSPNYFWNSGMIFFSLDSFRETLGQCQPRAFEAYKRILCAFDRDDDLEAIRAFESIPNISFDFAVMEHADHVTMIPASFSWDDVGAWDALARSFPADILGNIVQGRAAVIESQGCIIVNKVENSVVGVLGLQNYIVVNTPEGILVCPKHLAQRVREVSAGAMSIATRFSLA